MRRASRAAKMLALANEFQRLIDGGEVPDRAALAAHVGFTRARVIQILDLLLLAPDIQKNVLVSDVAGQQRGFTKCQLRGLTRAVDWFDQRKRWRVASPDAWARAVNPTTGFPRRPTPHA